MPSLRAANAPPEDTGERRDEQNPPGAGSGAGPAGVRRAGPVAPATEKDGVLVDGKGMTLSTYDKDRRRAIRLFRAVREELAAAGSGPGSAGQRRLEPGRSRGRHPAWAYYGKPFIPSSRTRSLATRTVTARWAPGTSPSRTWTDGRRPARRSTQRVVGDRAEEDRQASPVVVQEGAEAGLRVAVAGRPGLTRAGRRHRQAEVEAQAQFEAVAGQRQRSKVRPAG